MRRAAWIALVLLAGCADAPEKPSTASKPAASKPAASKPTTSKPATSKPATSKPATSKPAASKPDTSKATAIGAEGPLPPSDRVFVAKLDGKIDHVLGADGAVLWAARPTTPGRGVLLWRQQGRGVVQRVAYGDVGEGPRLFVARGVGRGHLRAPLSLTSLQPLSGVGKTVFQKTGPRNECAHLSVTDLDGDGKMDLAFAHYATKYTVQTRHFMGGTRPVEGAPIRMANARSFGDLNGDGKLDEAVARLYGDAKGLDGDLKVDLGGGPKLVPAEHGVRAVLIAGGALYFADAWVANYGKKANAQLKRATFDAKGAPTVVELGRSGGEFTFFELTSFDFEGDGRLDILARGDKRMTLFQPGATPKAPWTQRHVASLSPVLNTAFGRDGADANWMLYIPARPVTRVVTLR